MDRWKIARMLYWILGYIPIVIILSVCSRNILISAIVWAVPILIGDITIFVLIKRYYHMTKTFEKWDKEVKWK